MHLKRAIDKLTLYKTDLYEGRIIIIPNVNNISLKLSPNTFIQTDAVCWKKEENYAIIDCFNYVLCRKFEGLNNIENELYYNFDDLKDKGLDLEDFLPMLPNNQILRYYLEHSNISKNSYQKYIDYAAGLNKSFYRNGI